MDTTEKIAPVLSPEEWRILGKHEGTHEAVAAWLSSSFHFGAEGHLTAIASEWRGHSA